jgi:hypothetical protein
METNVELLDRLKGLERSSRLALPFIAIGLIAVISSLVYASVQLDRVREEVREAEEKRLKSAAETDAAEKRLATLQDLIEQLNADVQVAASGSLSSTERASILLNAAAAGEDLTRQSAAATAALTKLSTCNKVVSIRELGWRSGHKTKFCKAHGFAGVHNPFGDYSQGGYCYSGDLDTCMAQVQTASQ